jgi:hypothetical protein
MKHMIERVKNWSPETKKRIVYAATGVAVAVGSAIAVVDYLDRIRRKKTATVAELIAGVAGLAAGIAIATEPKREEKRAVEIEDLFEEEELQLIYQQISEVLNAHADGEVAIPAPRRAIEVDDAATIEDFI